MHHRYVHHRYVHHRYVHHRYVHHRLSAAGGAEERMTVNSYAAVETAKKGEKWSARRSEKPEIKPKWRVKPKKLKFFCEIFKELFSFK